LPAELFGKKYENYIFYMFFGGPKKWWGGKWGPYGLWRLSEQMSPANGACKVCVCVLIAPNDCMTERFGHDISPGIGLADAAL